MVHFKYLGFESVKVMLLFYYFPFIFKSDISNLLYIDSLRMTDVDKPLYNI